MPGLGAGATRGGATVLLADDNEAVLSVITAVLEALGCQTVLATDGAQAVDLYRAGRDEIALVILDVEMPGVGGIAASKAIRDINAAANILFLTGHDSTQQINTKGMLSEIVVVKPFKVAEFSQLVRSVLEHGPLVDPT